MDWFTSRRRRRVGVAVTLSYKAPVPPGRRERWAAEHVKRFAAQQRGPLVVPRNSGGMRPLRGWETTVATIPLLGWNASRLAAPLLAAFLLVGCGSDGSETQSPETTAAQVSETTAASDAETTATSTTADESTTTTTSPAVDLPESACDLLTQEELSAAVGSPVGTPGGDAPCLFMNPEAQGASVGLSIEAWSVVSGRFTLEQVEGSDIRYTAPTAGGTSSIDVIRFGEQAVLVTVTIADEAAAEAAEERVIEALIAKYGG